MNRTSIIPLLLLSLVILSSSKNANASCTVSDTEITDGCRDLGAISTLPMNGVDHCREAAAGFDYSLHLDFDPGPDCDENWREFHEECYGCSW